ncbi:MAG: DUF6281 family protein [Actinomycetes bacterium]
MFGVRTAWRTLARECDEKRYPRRVLSLGSTLAMLIIATSCANASEEGGGCALGFVRGETTYYPYEASRPLPRGRTLGRVPSVTCGDGAGEEAEPEFREAVAIRGIDPAVAFLVPSENPSMIFAPGPPDGSELPAEVEKLLLSDGG